MRQILYVSVCTAPGGKADLTVILEQSRHNNAIDGITGLLWSDGTHFMQVIEGPKASVEATFDRILRDTRHRDIRILVDVPIDMREFGGWGMMQRRAGEPADVYDAKIQRLLSQASEEVREYVHRLIATDGGVQT
ncbi:hypothetical protein ACVWZA_001034 [Sphingomonas sp. UYAg733]